MQPPESHHLLQARQVTWFGMGEGVGVGGSGVIGATHPSASQQVSTTPGTVIPVTNEQPSRRSVVRATISFKLARSPGVDAETL